MQYFKRFKKYIITNSSGTVRLDWDIGDLMIINKFIDFSFINSNKIEYSDIQFYSSQRQITVQREIYFSRFINAFDSRGPPANC